MESATTTREGREYGENKNQLADNLYMGQEHTEVYRVYTTFTVYPQAKHLPVLPKTNEQINKCLGTAETSGQMLALQENTILFCFVVQHLTRSIPARAFSGN